jgi:hypothetical protein
VLWGGAHKILLVPCLVGIAYLLLQDCKVFGFLVSMVTLG